jgi:hypothetical protein
MPFLWLAGVGLLVFAREWKPLLVLVAVPLYYLCFQSALHTEYRYIIAIHYFLFGLAGLSLYAMAGAVASVTRRVFASVLKRATRR